MDFDIFEGSVEDAYKVSQLIPEFDPPQYKQQEYVKRTSRVPSLILIASYHGNPAGFKVGYQRDNDGSFYSWMGGVLPNYRRQKVAQQLAHQQEQWAKENGYQKITFKTRNRNIAMLMFALKNDFKITKVTPKESIDDHRIWLEKILG
ncbi:MAG: GNAT family N-acetyltransferase [Cyclobacteriaceae bacterium]